jgi:hypothetical protein
MAALDTFEWFVTAQLKEPSDELKQYIRKEREYLFTLRSEDERQRAVEEAMSAINELVRARKK